MFLKIGDLAVCQTQSYESKDLKHCIADLMVDRKVFDFVEVTKKAGGYNDRRGGGNRDNNRRGGYNSKTGDDFERGTAKPQQRKAETWLVQDNNERAELRKKA